MASAAPQKDKEISDVILYTDFPEAPKPKEDATRDETDDINTDDINKNENHNGNGHKNNWKAANILGSIEQK